MHKFGVLIGRFEPYHIGHHSLVTFGLKNVEELVIVLGSCNVARSIKNPWSAQDRREMILSCLSKEEQDRVTFIEASDYLYNDNRWVTTIQQRVEEVTDGEEDVVLLGEEKDRSSFYLRMFPQWKHLSARSVFIPDLDATKIRQSYYYGPTKLDREYLKKVLPPSVHKMLIEDETSVLYSTLQKEYEFVQNYKKAWSKAPYPPTFVTVDAVVIQSGHVLLVKRKAYPGKGLMALPGGFVSYGERIQDAAIRELKEETRIALPKEDLHAAIVDSHVFDHPDRSTRGRTITHAFCLNLGTGKLPRVKGDDDAEHAFWLPLRELHTKQDQFYEDHNSIVEYFTSRW